MIRVTLEVKRRDTGRHLRGKGRLLRGKERLLTDIGRHQISGLWTTEDQTKKSGIYAVVFDNNHDSRFSHWWKGPPPICYY